MMRKGPVPIQHKENYKCQRKIHHEKYPTASTVLFQLISHSFTRFIFSRVADQKEAHHRETDIVDTQRAEPKGIMIKPKPKLKYSIQNVPYK